MNLPSSDPKKPQSHYFSADSTLLDARELTDGAPISIQVRGVTLQFLTGRGVFARAGLDEGSRLLLETLQTSKTAIFCDLGCGWGAVGAFWATFQPKNQIVALDVNPRAAQLAQANFQRNNLSNAHALCGDGLASFQSEIFDVISCNPPIRAGNATIARLFDDSHRVLKPGGALWVVIRTAQGAKSWQKKLATLFGNCETVRMRAGYRILRCVK